MPTTLVIANKLYSSWSLRPWLLLREARIPFDEIVIPLRQEDTQARIRRHSPAGKVPVLIDGDVTVWDSLAIVEYAAERWPEAPVWPSARVCAAFAPCPDSVAQPARGTAARRAAGSRAAWALIIGMSPVCR